MKKIFSEVVVIMRAKRWLLLVAMFFILISGSSWALTLKIACLAPEGTTWATMVKKFAKEVKKSTNGKVKFKVYFGGVAGDEPDVLRKIRIGQFHGGIFTGRTLGNIYGDVRVMEVPFTFFHDRDKAMDVLKKMSPYFNNGFEKAGMKNLGFFELGLAYLVSTKKATNLDNLKGIKIWAWEGDMLVKALMESLNLVSVQLALPDVLSSLSTGIIDAAYNAPIGTLALQWQNKVKYLINYPVAFGISALLVDMKNWKKISSEHQKLILKLGDKYSSMANTRTNIENGEALQAMKKLGIEFIDFPKSDLAKASQIRANTISKLKDKLISTTAIKKMKIYLKN